MGVRNLRIWIVSVTKQLVTLGNGSTTPWAPWVPWLHTHQV